jgi:hypothetical protein
MTWLLAAVCYSVSAGPEHPGGICIDHSIDGWEEVNLRCAEGGAVVVRGCIGCYSVESCVCNRGTKHAL